MRQIIQANQVKVGDSVNFSGIDGVFKINHISRTPQGKFEFYSETMICREVAPDTEVVLVHRPK